MGYCIINLVINILPRWSVFQMLTNVPAVLVRMVASALIPQEGTNARVSEAGIQGGTVMKVSLAKEAT